MNQFVKLIVAFWRWLWQTPASQSTPYKTIYVDGLPANLQSKTIYISGEDGLEWFALFLCPCGCQEAIQLSILPNTRPTWKLIKNPNGTITLHPSVWRTKGCKSHFFFESGYIKWV